MNSRRTLVPWTNNVNAWIVTIGLAILGTLTLVFGGLMRFFAQRLDDVEGAVMFSDAEGIVLVIVGGILLCAAYAAGQFWLWPQRALAKEVLTHGALTKAIFIERRKTATRRGNHRLHDVCVEVDFRRLWASGVKYQDVAKLRPGDGVDVFTLETHPKRAWMAVRPKPRFF